jgi:hypothetical protein
MKKYLKTLMVFMAMVGARIASAQAATFDSSTFIGDMTAGVGSAATVAQAIAGLSVGVLVLIKVRKYFGKAG